MTTTGSINDALETLTSHSFSEWLASDPSLHYECVDQCVKAIGDNFTSIAKVAPDDILEMLGPSVLNIASNLAALELSSLKDELEVICGSGRDPRFQQILNRVDVAINYHKNVSEDCFTVVSDIVNISKYGD